MKRVLWLLALITALTIPLGTALADSFYVVQPGDTLWSISQKFGTTVADIAEANGIDDVTFIIAGNELIIPGDGNFQAAPEAPAAVATTPVTEAPAAPAPIVADPVAVPVTAGPELLPNASFEGDWYFYLYNELQIPDGWQLSTYEGPNTLQPGSGGLFNRPEVRVVPSYDLPPSEHSQFIMDGIKTVKAFKGGAPTQFSLFTDVYMQPGTYRLEVRFFADTVIAYERGQKIFAYEPYSAEMRFIHNDSGSAWQAVTPGQQSTLTYDFTVTEPGTVRLGAGFRNRYVAANNGWFIDDWSLTAIE